MEKIIENISGICFINYDIELICNNQHFFSSIKEVRKQIILEKKINALAINIKDTEIGQFNLFDFVITKTDSSYSDKLLYDSGFYLFSKDQEKLIYTKVPEIWRMIRKNIKNIFDFGNLIFFERNIYANTSLGWRNVDYHFFSRDHMNLDIGDDIHKSTKTNLDIYCEKMDIEKIDLLNIGDSIEIYEKSNIKYVDIVMFRTNEAIKNKLSQKFLIFHDIIFGISVATNKNIFCKKNNIPITCINLEKSIERKNKMKQQLKLLGNRYEFFSAINGIDVEVHKDKNMVQYKNQMFKYIPIQRHVYRELSYGEIGCFLSHIFCIQKNLEKNVPHFLILEDNNHILDINLAIDQLNNIPEADFDICLLSDSMNTELVISKYINNYFGYSKRNNFNLANAVLYSRKGAEKVFLNYISFGICMPFDKFLEKCQLSIIIPSVKLYKTCFKSDIWSVYKPNESYHNVIHDKKNKNIAIFMDWDKYARMGNCMFQYAFLKSLSMGKNANLFFDYNSKELDLFPNLKYSIYSGIENYIEINETKFEYQEELKNICVENTNYKYKGFFQSYKYFSGYENFIRDCFDISPEYKDKALRQYMAFSGENTQICGVHIRLKDTRCENNFRYTIPSENYIKKAISHFQNQKIRYIVFSNDIEECKNKYNYLFPEDTAYSYADRYSDFAFLTVCDHLIISAGTFGWWGAYLNKSKNKKIICISPNFNNSDKNEKDYYPSEWICISND